MASRAAPFFLTFVRDLPPLETIVGGEQIRPFELIHVLAERGWTGEVWCVQPSAVRDIGGIRVRRLPLPRWGVVREIVSPLVAIAIFLHRSVVQRRVVLYQRVHGAVSVAHGLVYLSEPGLPLFALARFLRVRTCAAMQDLSPEHEEYAARRAEASVRSVVEAEQRRRRRVGRINARVQRWALPRSDVVTVVSESLRREVIERYVLDPDRVLVIRAGVNPTLVRDLPEWSPPTKGQRWAVGYVGSRYDFELPLLLDAISRVGAPVRLVLAGRGMDDVRTGELPNVETRDASYSQFASLAAEVDIWVVPLGSDPYLHWGWHLKFPMDLATGRPVVITSTDELELSGCADLFFVADDTAAGLAGEIDRIARDPDAAKAKAANSQEVALREMTWSMQLDELLSKFE